MNQPRTLDDIMNMSEEELVEYNKQQMRRAIRITAIQTGIVVGGVVTYKFLKKKFLSSDEKTEEA